MEDSLRESKLKQKQAEENLKIEVEKQSQLSSRLVIFRMRTTEDNCCTKQAFPVRYRHILLHKTYACGLL